MGAWLRWIAGSSWLLVAACGTPPRAADTGLRVVDDAGDTVSLAHPAARIVSLEPTITELLFGLGAGPQVVGRTPWCDYPAAAQRVPVVAEAIGPNVEAVAAVQPDLVVLYPSASNAAAAARLRELGIAVVQAATNRFEDVPRLARLLGRLTGHPHAADSLTTVFRASLDSATRHPARRPSVFVLAWTQPPMTIGRGSFLSELIERAGGRNLFDDLSASSAPISIEAVASRNPDLILSTGASATPVLAGRPEWQVVPAVRDRRFIRISGSEFDHPGPRSPQAVAELGRKLAEAGW